MRLHVEVTGNGRPLVMLHGWGMHGGIWQEAAAQLAEDYAVQVVDLPGHGASPLMGRFTLEEVVDTLADSFSVPVAVLGWSLGGIIAQQWAAQAPGQIRSLILVASTPCFTARPDWAWGMSGETLQQFAAELEHDHAATLRRFLALQLRGSENERELLALLRQRLFSRGGPDRQALRGGLDILRDADLRPRLSQLHQPVLAVAGERDRLTPPAASEYLAQAIRNAQAVVIEGAAHVPFLSHPDIFMTQVRRFLHEHI